MYNFNSNRDNFSYICVLFQFCMEAGMRPEPVSEKLAKLCTTLTHGVGWAKDRHSTVA